MEVGFQSSSLVWAMVARDKRGKTASNNNFVLWRPSKIVVIAPVTHSTTCKKLVKRVIAVFRGSKAVVNRVKGAAAIFSQGTLESAQERQSRGAI